MIELLWAISTAGLTYFITNSHLTRKFREWATSKNKILSDLVNCEFCTGTWAGLLMYFVIIVLKVYLLGYIFAGGILSLLVINLTKYLKR